MINMNFVSIYDESTPVPFVYRFPDILNEWKVLTSRNFALAEGNASKVYWEEREKNNEIFYLLCHLWVFQ